MARPNYSYEKRQKELAKKAKKEEKRKRKLEQTETAATEVGAALAPAEGDKPAE